MHYQHRPITIDESNINTVVFGGGCFWCVEAVFKNIDGVITVTSGYAGGTTKNPTYDTVSSGKTGHAEVIEIEYEPAIVPFRKLLEIFFDAHDPTTLNRQDADVGSQYRSIILYANQEQKSAAEDYIKELEKKPEYKEGIVTEVMPLEEFYPAEKEHQDFYSKHKGAPYCQAVIEPKLAKIAQKRTPLKE